MHHGKRERNEREKHSSQSSALSNSVVGKCNSPTRAALNVASVVGGSSPAHVAGQSGKANVAELAAQSPKSQQSNTAQSAVNSLKAAEETYSGYNSGDEHLQPKEGAKSPDEWQTKDEQFAKCMSESGYILKPVEEDGACLFRSISLQIYGDEDMHDVIRQNTMDYIVSRRRLNLHVDGLILKMCNFVKIEF